MADTEYAKIELEKSGMKIILEFPRRAESEESIRQEVREILSNALLEYWEKLS